MDVVSGLISELGRRLYRARRRALVAATMAGLSGLLLYAPIGSAVLGLPFPVFAGLLYAATVGASSFLVCAALPGLRHMIELVAVSRLVVSVCAFGIPAIGFAVITSPLLSATLVVGGAALVRMALVGRLAGLCPEVPGSQTVVTTRSRLSLGALQSHLSTLDMRAAPLNAGFRDLPGGGRALDIDNRVHLNGVEVRDLGHVREVTLQVSRPAMPLPLWISGWIDDTMGRACDQLLPHPAPRRAIRSVTGTALVP